MASLSDHIGRPSSRTTHNYREQAGLEVVPQEQLQQSTDWSDLQAVHEPSDYHQQDGKEVVSQEWENHKFLVVAMDDNDKQQTPPAKGRRRLLWYIIGGIVLLVVVLAAVLGGVLGTRAAGSSQVDESSQPAGEAKPTSTSSSAPSSSTPTVSTTVALQSIRQGSPLTVGGWQKPGGVEIFLFYQDHDNQLRRSQNNNTKASSSDDSSWAIPKKYNSFAGEGSRLGSTIIQYGDGYLPQTELFYTGDDNRLLGVSINDNLSPAYEEDSIKSMALKTGSNSSVGTYWPWIVYQGPDGGLVEVRNRLRSEFSPAAEWDAKKLGVAAADASRLALVPLSTNFSKIAIQGGYGIFYQETSGHLVALVPDLGSNELAEDYEVSWPADLPSIKVPDRGSFAAFSVARPSDALQRVNTYLLYLDSTSNINVVYADSSSSAWKTSQPAVLKDVDSDTDIACLTMATTHRDSTKSEVLLERASTETRCYFQRGGLVREVSFDGTEWADVGNVPMP